MFKGLKALIAGALAGTAVGILFAPKKGKQIRDSIKDELSTGGTGLSSVKDTLVEMGKEIGGTCKECYSEIAQSEEYKEGKEKLKKYASQAKEEAKKAYKKNVPSKTRKKISKTVLKAKKTVGKAKATATKIKNKIPKNK